MDVCGGTICWRKEEYRERESLNLMGAKRGKNEGRQKELE